MSSLAIARGLADGGRLICFDISEEYTSHRPPVLAAGGRRRPDRPADRAGRGAAAPSCPPSRTSTSPSSTRTRPATRRTGRSSCPACVPGGVIVIDNVLRGGRVVAPSTESDKVDAWRSTSSVRADDRVDVDHAAARGRPHARPSALTGTATTVAPPASPAEPHGQRRGRQDEAGHDQERPVRRRPGRRSSRARTARRRTRRRSRTTSSPPRGPAGRSAASRAIEIASG